MSRWLVVSFHDPTFGKKRPVCFMYSRYLSPNFSTRLASSFGVRIATGMNASAPSAAMNQLSAIIPRETNKADPNVYSGCRIQRYGPVGLTGQRFQVLGL